MTQELLKLSAENIRLKAQLIRKDKCIQEQSDKIKEMESESIDFARYLLWRPEQFKGQNVKDIYRKFQKTMPVEDEDLYNPYCKVCGGCGEDGCCSALHCKQSKDGDYCESYLNDLKYGYLMYKDLYGLLSDDKETQLKLKEIINKNYKLVYEETRESTV